VAETTFAEDIGRALRQLWDTASEGLVEIGQFQGMERVGGEAEPSDLTFSDLRDLMGRLRDPSPVLENAFGGGSGRVRLAKEILAGFTGRELAAIADGEVDIPHRPGAPFPSTGSGGLEKMADRFRDAAFVSGQVSDLNALSRFLTPAERQIYNRLMEDDRLDYLRGKAEALAARAASNQRHQNRFDKMQMGAPESGEESDPFADFLNSLLGDLFGGGGGGGGAGRIYQGPDPAAVRDQIRLMMVALVGKADDALIDEMVQMFLTQDRERVMNNAPIDPAQSVRDRIRQTESYKRIHKLRPEGVAEEDWLPAYRQVLTAAGIPMTTIDDLAIKFAQSGLNPATFTEEGFATRQLAETDVAAPSLQQNASQIGRAIGALIR
jgi:hypothetical protein